MELHKNKEVWNDMADSRYCQLVIHYGQNNPHIFIHIDDGRVDVLAEEGIWLLSRGMDAPLFRVGWEGWGVMRYTEVGLVVWS